MVSILNLAFLIEESVLEVHAVLKWHYLPHSNKLTIH